MPGVCAYRVGITLADRKRFDLTDASRELLIYGFGDGPEAGRRPKWGTPLVSKVSFRN
jgi:hypothetical protein